MFYFENIYYVEIFIFTSATEYINIQIDKNIKNV